MDKNICFLSLGSYPLLISSEEPGCIGGAELMQVLIGKELSKRGYHVSFITFKDTETSYKIYDNITIIQSYPSLKKISLIRRFWIIWQCLKSSNANYYLHSSCFPGITAIYCLIKRKKFVYRVSSDRNVLLMGVGVKSSLIAKIALYIDIKLSNLIIVQNEYQKQILENKFKKKTLLIKNPIDITEYSPISDSNNDYILWVNTIRDIKQPWLFLDLTKSLPELKFVMIGGMDPNESDLYNRIEKAARLIPNLKFLGFIPHHKIYKYYKNAIVVVNTSKTEGFPNVFLESWINCVPVISLNIDPDEVICKYNLGFHSNSFDELVTDIRLVANNPQLRELLGKNGRMYVKNEHDLKIIVNKYLVALDNIY